MSCRSEAVSGFYIEGDGSDSNEEVGRRVKELLQDRPLTTGSPMSLLALAGLGQPSGSNKSEPPNAVGFLPM